MYIFIEKDSLNTPIVTLTPIFSKEKQAAANAPALSIKLPQLEIVVAQKESVQLWDLVRFE